MTRKIEIWASTTPGVSDPTTHLWLRGAAKSGYRFCDGAGWSELPVDRATDRPYVPCSLCQELYTLDATLDEQRFGPLGFTPLDDGSVHRYPNLSTPLPESGVAVTELWEMDMVTAEVPSVPLTMFARYYDATGPQKVSIVRDVRMMLSDPGGYRSRDYYHGLRNTLRRTHWKTNNIETFVNALDPLLGNQRQTGKRQHYETIALAYIDFWKRFEGRSFAVSGTIYDLAGLRINMSLDIGMRFRGDEVALKLWLNAQPPKRTYRQAVQFLIGKAEFDWPANWASGIWDVRRQAILPTVKLPRDFAIAIEGQAAAFQQTWHTLGE